MHNSHLANLSRFFFFLILAGAVRYIVEQSASEILKIFLLDADTLQQQQRRQWTPEQAWLLIKQLAEQETVSYFFFHNIFSFSFAAPLFFSPLP
jgi:hypothetical protein